MPGADFTRLLITKSFNAEQLISSRAAGTYRTSFVTCMKVNESHSPCTRLLRRGAGLSNSRVIPNSEFYAPGTWFHTGLSRMRCFRSAFRCQALVRSSHSPQTHCRVFRLSLIYYQMGRNCACEQRRVHSRAFEILRVNSRACQQLTVNTRA